MRLTLLHPPHTGIGSRVPKENLQPVGLLCIGGPLSNHTRQTLIPASGMVPGRTPDHHVSTFCHTVAENSFLRPNVNDRNKLSE